MASDRARRTRTSSNGLRSELMLMSMCSSQGLSSTLAFAFSKATIRSRSPGEKPRNSARTCWPPIAFGAATPDVVMALKPSR